jgi:HAD superfamily phosphoserine phosphatase-like hydrolase
MEKKYQKFTAVVPSYNEEKRCCHVIKELLKIKYLDELIFVDDGSTDNTEKVVNECTNDPRFHYVPHKKNKGKGAALKTGVKKAKNEVILFLDADLMNITYQKIKKIVDPVLTDEVDVSRGAFRRARGRVTEYAVKPMMRVLFPEMYFEQPISGQVCAKKSFLTEVDFESNFGVDIGILFDAIQAGERIVEVDIGWLEHKASDDASIARMSEQVLETMIKKAGLIQHKYKLVIFTLDDTLIPTSSLKQIFKKMNIGESLESNLEKNENDKIDFKTFLINSAKLFKGSKKEDALEIAARVKLAKYAPEVISALKKRKYQVAIISSNFSPIVEPIAKRLGADFTYCVGLEEDKGVFTGNITADSKERWLNVEDEIAFKKAFVSVMRRAKVKANQTIMVASSERSIPLTRSAGLSIAYKPKSKELKEAVDKTITLHAEILALIE